MKEDVKQLSLDLSEAPAPPVARSLNKVAIIRHGDHLREILTTKASADLERLGLELKNISGEEAVCLLSSDSLRAVNSAQILANILNVQVNAHRLLFSRNEDTMDLEAAYKLIHGVANNGLVIAVTHFEYADELPGYLGRQDLGKEFGDTYLEKGEGVLLDYRLKTLSRL